MNPYYQDDHVQLFHGDMREVLPALGITADACVTDPPYGETSLPWDRWVDGWPALVASCTASMWCFGSMRMFTGKWSEFANWKLSQDVVWEKQAGSGFAADRFRRVHEFALHFYRGRWSECYRWPIRVEGTFGRHGEGVRTHGKLAHTGAIREKGHVGDGTSLQRSVIKARNCNGHAIHPTQKPAAILSPLIEYAVPPGGVVLDPFAGSCSTLLTARQLGRRTIGIEADEKSCESAAERLSIPDLFGGAA